MSVSDLLTGGCTNFEVKHISKEGACNRRNQPDFQDPPTHIVPHSEKGELYEGNFRGFHFQQKYSAYQSRIVSL